MRQAIEEGAGRIEARNRELTAQVQAVRTMSHVQEESEAIKKPHSSNAKPRPT